MSIGGSLTINSTGGGLDFYNNEDELANTSMEISDDVEANFDSICMYGGSVTIKGNAQVAAISQGTYRALTFDN